MKSFTLQQCKDKIAQSKGNYLNWADYESWIIEVNQPVGIAQLLIGAMDEAAQLHASQYQHSGMILPTDEESRKIADAEIINDLPDLNNSDKELYMTGKYRGFLQAVAYFRSQQKPAPSPIEFTEWVEARRYIRTEKGWRIFCYTDWQKTGFKYFTSQELYQKCLDETQKQLS